MFANLRALVILAATVVGCSQAQVAGAPGGSDKDKDTPPVPTARSATPRNGDAGIRTDEARDVDSASPQGQDHSLSGRSADTWGADASATSPRAEAGIDSQVNIVNPGMTEAVSSRLPVVIFDIDPARLMNGVKVPSRMRVIEDHEGSHADLLTRPVRLETPIGIAIRGNSSAAPDVLQKSFSVEIRDAAGLARSAPLLGMPAEEDWAFIACWPDKTCMRNALAHSIGRDLGRWNPRTRFVEVFLGTLYNGLYLVVEPPRRSKNRIAISKPALSAAEGDLSGGYIIRKESGGKGVPKSLPLQSWVSSVTAPADGFRRTVFSYHYPRPEDITPAQKEYLHASLATFEGGMKADDWRDKYRGLIDTPSFVDHMLIRELANETDAYSKSNYFVKMSTAAGGKLHMLPLWDFNIAFGNSTYRDCQKTDVWAHEMGKKFFGTCSAWVPAPPGCAACIVVDAKCSNMPYVPFWWERLWTEPTFRKDLRCRWEDLRRDTLSAGRIAQTFDTWSERLLPLAVPRHFKKYPQLLGKVEPNFFVGTSKDPTLFFREEVAWLRDWVDKRIRWMDANLPGTCPRP